MHFTSFQQEYKHVLAVFYVKNESVHLETNCVIGSPHHMKKVMRK